MTLYRDVLRVPEYFLFDPYEEWLEPRLRGYRLRQGRYAAIRPVAGRLPSKILGLHLERHGQLLRFHDPATGKWLLTPPEVEAAMREIEVENIRLRAQVAELQRRLNQP